MNQRQKSLDTMDNNTNYNQPKNIKIIQVRLVLTAIIFLSPFEKMHLVFDSSTNSNLKILSRQSYGPWQWELIL